MKTVFFSLLLFLFSFPLSAEERDRTISVLAHGELYQLAQDPAVATAVISQNSKKITLEQIVRQDKTWQSSKEISPLMKQVLENDCAKYLHSLKKTRPYLAEIFVMDNLGANVATTNRTSDYWQGDEAKFQKAMNKGAGAVVIDALEFDESAQVELIQVTVPVMLQEEAIGAVTFGIDPKKLLGKK